MLAGRPPSQLGPQYKTGGRILFGAAIPSEAVISSVVSYVSQEDDALIPTLTVRETLNFAAQLRLPRWMSNKEKTARAESVLRDLNLRDCAETVIGDIGRKGISQGERHRVSIAVQLLTDPYVLVLDEPTSGLDAFTAATIIEILRGLATSEKKTIILSIHQPRSDLFKYFDHILLLARGGSPVYAGEGQLILPHFSALGHDCPLITNPADFVLDLITVDWRDSAREISSRDRVSSLESKWHDMMAKKKEERPDQSNAIIGYPAELGSIKRGMTPLFIAFPLLLRRSILGYRRSSLILDARLAQVFGFTVVITLFWSPLKSNYEGVQSRLGFVQQQMGESKLVDANRSSTDLSPRIVFRWNASEYCFVSF